MGVPALVIVQRFNHAPSPLSIAMFHKFALSLLFVLSPATVLFAAKPKIEVEAKVYELATRASTLDPRAGSYPEIKFLLTGKNGEPEDQESSRVDTRVASRERLVIWLMAPNKELFERLNGYGLHVIQPDYARDWFSSCCQEDPVSPDCRGNLRLEVATGLDVSDEVNLKSRDSMMGRSLVLLRHLCRTQPRANWDQFLTANKKMIRWDRVIVAGSSHGSTTAARFAKHQEVARVVMLCGPRDQFQNWQSLPSATPAQRYFGFSHVQDMGWKQDHYCRSWEMIGLHEFGPLTIVDESEFPFANSRRLLTNFDVGGDEKVAHGSVQPGRKAARNADGSYRHEEVWKYLFTHPVDVVGTPVAMDPSCEK